MPDGKSISDYFDENGSPKFDTSGSSLRVVTEKLTKSEISTRRAERRAERLADKDAAKAAEQDDYTSPYNLENWVTGKFSLDDGTPLTAPMAVGKIRMAVANFVRKLARVPTIISTYRNVADLKAKNPRLYEQAVAARPQGDFDTVSAVGYSFGSENGPVKPTVIIFTDRVATERQLKFVLAHEILGHFGFRGLMSEKELRGALELVYQSSERVRAGVDLTMAARKGMGEAITKEVAIEEYLADFAGSLDTNVLAKFWNAIKNALNKLGVRFDDDMARYIVNQSRRYVRNGTVAGSFVDFRKIAGEMVAFEGMQDPFASGRLALASEAFSNFNQMAADRVLAPVRENVNIQEFWKSAKEAKVDWADFGSRLIGELKTMNFAARDNRGYRALYEIMRDTVNKAAKLRAQYDAQMKTILSPAVQIGGQTFGGGATEEQIAVVSGMLRDTSRVKRGMMTDAQLRALGDLVVIRNGNVETNQVVRERAAALGRFTPEDFRNGIEYTVQVPAEMTAAERTRLNTERDVELARLDAELQRYTQEELAATVAIQNAPAGTDTTALVQTRDNARRNMEKLRKESVATKKSYEIQVAKNTYMVEQKRRIAPIPGITKDSIEWKMYEEVRDTMDEAAIDLLKANYAAVRGERDNILDIVRRFLGRQLTQENRDFIERVENRYITLRDSGIKVNDRGFIEYGKAETDRANNFLIAFNAAVIGEQTDRNKLVTEFFDVAERDDVIANIEALKANSRIIREGDQKFTMQQAIQNLALFEGNKANAELHALTTITGGYVPFGREGKWQIRLVAMDPTTKQVYKVSNLFREQLLYMQVEDRSDAEAVSEEVNGILSGVEGGFRMEVMVDGEFKMKDVTLVATYETTRDTESHSGANLNEVIAALNRFQISINPIERERLVVGLTRQNARARSRLRRTGTPGEDPNTMKYVSRHLEWNASTVARKTNQHRTDRLYDDSSEASKELWFGTQSEYDRRKAAYEAARDSATASDATKMETKRAFEEYQYTFVTKESQKLGNRYKNQGKRLLSFLESQRSVEFADFGSGEIASRLRLWTTFAQMGLSPATAVLNYLALPTNVLPVLSGYNRKNGFGGGFGWGRSSAALTLALKQTASNNQSDIAYWDKLLGRTEFKPEAAIERDLNKLGLTRYEAEFMRKEVAEGTMQAALTNSMLGTARGRMTSGVAQKAATTIMGMFNYTEQSARRATGLAAFRMAYDRALQEGKTPDQAFDAADRVAVDIIQNTLGEYAMYNRPAFFRGGIGQFLFMYKMFVVNTVQMLSALSRKDQLLALGILVLFSGLKGLPFGDDLFDLLDTIAQKLGLGPKGWWRGGAERTVAEVIDAVAPNLTPLLMRGVFNYLTPANISDRVSLSNVIPGTGIALAKADGFRELLEIGGPMASFLQQMAATSVDVAKFGLESVGVLPDNTTINSLLRTSPVTMLRAAGDMATYHNTGAIVSQKGYVVSEDLHGLTYLARALGFYPEAATRANDAIRLARRTSNYRSDIAAMFYSQYVGASLANDSEKVQQVLQTVSDWNEAAKGTDLELTNFKKSATRALKEARRPAGDRFLRSLPTGARADAERMMDIIAPEEE